MEAFKDVDGAGRSRAEANADRWTTAANSIALAIAAMPVRIGDLASCDIAEPDDLQIPSGARPSDGELPLSGRRHGVGS